MNNIVSIRTDESAEPPEPMPPCLSDISSGFTSEIDDKERFVKVLEQRKTFLFVVERLLNACSALKAQIVKVLKKCFRMH